MLRIRDRKCITLLKIVSITLQYTLPRADLGSWNKYNTAALRIVACISVARQRPVNSNRGTVLSKLSVPRYYKHGSEWSEGSWVELSEVENSWLVSEWVSEWEDCWGSVTVSCCCEKLVAEAVASSVTQGKENARRWKPLPMWLWTLAGVFVCVCVSV
jgi:hypothetical protein